MPDHAVSCHFGQKDDMLAFKSILIILFTITARKGWPLINNNNKFKKMKIMINF